MLKDVKVSVFHRCSPVYNVFIEYIVWSTHTLIYICETMTLYMYVHVGQSQRIERHARSWSSSFQGE